MKFQQTVEKTADAGDSINYDKILDLIISISTNLLMAAAILVIGFWIVKTIMKVFIILAAIGKVGVDTASLVGLIAAAGFAVGMALQGSLANFAAGIMITVFKPYKIGDWVEIGEKFGKVETIQIFNTSIVTPGQKTHIIPNGQVTEGTITNFSDKGKIRLELNVVMPYEESFPKIKNIILKALEEVPLIMQDPAPEVGIETYDSHNVVLAVRPFINPDNYWDATFECNAVIKKAFSENRIKMAYSEGIELGTIGE